MATQSLPVRAEAARVLHAVAFEGRSLNQCLPESLARVATDDRGRLQDLAYGGCRWWHRLQGELALYLKKPLRKADKPVEALLILALYELRESGTASHAVVHQTVEACRALRRQPLAGLVNAVLRRATAGKPPAPDSDAVRYSHPAWMIEKLRHNWPDHWQAILTSNNAHPPMVLRVNAQRGSRETYLAKLDAAGIEATPCEYSARAIRLQHPCPVTRLPGFEAGEVSVQDEAAQLCTALLAPQARERVLEACAAPGGKTAALLEVCPDLDLLALDRDGARLARVTENLERLGLSARIQTADAADTGSWWDGHPFQRILLDAPCSGSGVIRRHPDIKLLRRETDIQALGSTQLRLLEQLWPTLAPGGRLVYATCSVFPQENHRIISRFMRDRDDVALAPIAADWGMDTGAGRQLFPVPGGHDGFFYAILEKPLAVSRP